MQMLEINGYKKWVKIPNSRDMFNLREEYNNIHLEWLKSCGHLLPDVLPTLHKLQKANIKIGHTSDLTEKETDVIIKNVQREGYWPDFYISKDTIKHGKRPRPYMIYENLKNLNIDSIHSVIKVDDTTDGIKEGLNAGCWSVGVYKYSNYINYNSIEFNPLVLSNETALTLEEKEKIAFEKLKESEAHYVVDTINKLPCIIQDINQS